MFGSTSSSSGGGGSGGDGGGTSQPQDGPVKPKRAYKIILAMPGNNECADCKAPQPIWASINLGITLCKECSEIHKNLGTKYSRIRSLTLDTEAWSPEIVQLMLNLGNSSVNSAYLACFRNQVEAIKWDSCRTDRESWIKDKYILKKFMRPPDANLDDSSFLNDSMNEIEEINKQSPGDHQEEPKITTKNESSR